MIDLGPAVQRFRRLLHLLLREAAAENRERPGGQEVLFGAAAMDFLADFLADFFADFLAFFADFLAVFFEDFLADFFFAVTRLFLAFLAFLPPFFFLPLAIVILLLPPTNVYRAFQVVRPLKLKAQRSVQSWPGTACRPIEKLNRVHHRN